MRRNFERIKVTCERIKVTRVRPVRRRLRYAYRQWHFRRAMRAFLAAPEEHVYPDDPLFEKLVFGWGNEAWSGHPEYLAGCLRHALVADGPILECGSGLSTLLVGAIAARRGRRLWTLEHAPVWAERMERCLRRYRLDAVVYCVAPLKEYGAFSWYDPPLDVLPESFSLVLCDGPPGDTPGGRYGLAPVMQDRLPAGCVVLLDDADREAERAIAAAWADDLSASLRTVGQAKPYLELTIHDAPGPPRAATG